MTKNIEIKTKGQIPVQVYEKSGEAVQFGIEESQGNVEKSIAR